MRKKSVSDRHLFDLWSQAVQLIWRECIVCKNKRGLCGHHVVHRNAYILRWDWRNAVAVCDSRKTMKGCHDWCDTLKGREYVKNKIIEKFSQKRWDYILYWELIKKPDYLVSMGITDNEFRRQKLEELKNKIKELS